MAVVLADSLDGVALTTDGEFYVQNDLGLILADGNAIDLPASFSRVLIRGTVGGGLGDGINVAGQFNAIFVAATGFVSGNKTGIFSAIGTVANRVIVNDGGMVEALDIGVHMNGNSHSVMNSGSIIGRQVDGVRFEGSFGDLWNFGEIVGRSSGVRVIGNESEIWNEGRISGRFSPGVHIDGSDNRLVNTGEIVSLEGAGVRFETVAGEANSMFNSGTISGQDLGGNNAVVGGDGNETIVNRGTIDGNVSLGGGSDVFDGTGGTVAGSVSGGDGSDRYIVDDPTLTLVERPGQGFDLVAADTSWALGADFERLNLLGGGDHAGFGNDLDNIINGNIGNNVLDGFGGNDAIGGGIGDDVIGGGGGDDRLAGNDGNDVIRGGPGEDNLRGDDGDDRVIGGLGKDSLLGGDGDDRLIGGLGDDRLVGGGGADVLIGGMGRDVLFGGTDADRFVYDGVLESPVGAVRDRIQQFSSAQGDRIDLSGIDADPNTADDDGFAFIGTSAFSGSAGELRFVNVGSNLFVRGDVDGDGIGDFEIFVNNTATLTAGDFVL